MNAQPHRVSRGGRWLVAVVLVAGALAVGTPSTAGAQTPSTTPIAEPEEQSPSPVGESPGVEDQAVLSGATERPRTSGSGAPRVLGRTGSEIRSLAVAALALLALGTGVVVMTRRPSSEP